MMNPIKNNDPFKLEFILFCSIVRIQNSCYTRTKFNRILMYSDVNSR